MENPRQVILVNVFVMPLPVSVPEYGQNARKSPELCSP